MLQSKTIEIFTQYLLDDRVCIFNSAEAREHSECPDLFEDVDEGMKTDLIIALRIYRESIYWLDHAIQFLQDSGYEEASKALDVEFAKRVDQLHEPCPACAGCAEYDSEPDNMRFPYIEAYCNYIAPGESTDKLIKQDLDVYYCPSCGRCLQI